MHIHTSTPHKAVAEISMIRNYGRGELLYVQQSKSTDGPKSGWSCLFGWVAMVTSPTTAGYSCSAVQCSVL